MRPRICPTCTTALGRETRHKAGRLCSQVQTEKRRETNPARRQYDARRKARLRNCGGCLHSWTYHVGRPDGCEVYSDDDRRCGCPRERPDAP